MRTSSPAAATDRSSWSGWTGDLDLDTGDGSIRGYDLAGKVRIHTGDGSVSLEQVDGSLDVDTGDGTVSIAGKLQGVKAATGDGTVVVRAEDGSAMTDSWEIRTGDGGVRLELPDGFAATSTPARATGGCASTAWMRRQHQSPPPSTARSMRTAR